MGILTTLAHTVLQTKLKFSLKKIKKIYLKFATKATFVEMYITRAQRVRRQINPMLMLLLVVPIMMGLGLAQTHFELVFTGSPRHN